MTDGEFLANCPLFAGIPPNNANHLFSRLSVHSKTFSRGQTILRQGQAVGGMGMIVSGIAFEKRYCADGSCEIVSVLGKNEIFGEGAIFDKNAECSCDVSAETECEAFFFHFSQLSPMCVNDCALLSPLMKNVVRILAQKNEMLKKRILVLARRSVKDKILAALDIFFRDGKIPFGIGEFADFLCVDRSALWRAIRQISNSQKILFVRRKSQEAF